MTEISIQFTANQSNSIPVAQIENRSGHARYLIAMALIRIGGIVTVVWIGFLGWTVGNVFNLW